VWSVLVHDIPSDILDYGYRHLFGALDVAAVLYSQGIWQVVDVRPRADDGWRRKHRLKPAINTARMPRLRR
jgi:hypothetical protein